MNHATKQGSTTKPPHRMGTIAHNEKTTTKETRTVSIGMPSVQRDNVI